MKSKDLPLVLMSWNLWGQVLFLLTGRKCYGRSLFINFGFSPPPIMHLRMSVHVLQACSCGGTASGSVRNSSIEDDSSACAHPISGVPRLLLVDVAQMQNGGWRRHLTRLGVGTR